MVGTRNSSARDQGEIAQHLKVRRGQRGVQASPSAGLEEEHGRGDEADDGDQRADGHIHVGHRRHAGQCRGDDDKDGDDVGAQFRRDGVRKDEVQHVAAALELVAGDADISKEDGDGAEDARGLVVAGLEQVRQGELGELAGARAMK